MPRITETSLVANIVYAVLVLIIVITIACEYYTFKTGVPTVASLPSTRKKMIELLQKDAESRPNARPYRIIDLGSGSGQLSWHIARAMPYAHVTGIELSHIPIWRSIMRQHIFGPMNLDYQRADFWPYDVSGAEAIVVFLNERVMERTGQKLRKEVKPGTLILINDSWLGSAWAEPDEEHFTGFLQSKVLLYRQK
jgi:SAM-dependent methyltransferase